MADALLGCGSLELLEILLVEANGDLLRARRVHFDVEVLQHVRELLDAMLCPVGALLFIGPKRGERLLPLRGLRGLLLPRGHRCPFSRFQEA
jgi:hypothetical protein